MIGRTFGHYRIDAQLGAGGMGIVYKAHDTRLERFVAIKVLPADAAGHPERRRRFVQEAKAASALNHPNIVHVYDIETADDVAFIAMEHVDGQTLGDLLGRKALPIRDTLKYASQIADGLAAAHAAGIVHRDIKPGNVMVTPQGLVKILDFGLAKLTEPAEDVADAATRTMQPMTEQGTIVGTVAYMSPEQAEGLPVDARSDVFSFGSVLYEMATGARAFQGQTKLSTLSAILHQEPKPPSAITPAIPRELERIIGLCLRKDPRRRLQHMDDLKTQLEALTEQSESGQLSQHPGVADTMPSRRRWWPVALAAGVSVALVASVVTWWVATGRRAGAAPIPKPMMRLTSDTGLTTTPTLSPDGKLVAYASDRAGADNLDIWVQQISGGAPLRLTSDTASEYEPAFSPDGSRIVFRSERDGGGVYTIPTLGGDSRLVAKGGRNPSFSPDGSRIAFVTGVGGLGGVAAAALFTAPAVGGTPQQLVPVEIGAAAPIWSPDGNFILFARGFYGIDGWAIVPSTSTETLSGTGSPIVLSLETLQKGGVAEATPKQWLPGNRVVFSAKLGDAAHVFEIGLSPPTMLDNQWRLDASATRLTFGTGQEDSPSLASGVPGAATRRLVFASLSRSENIWSVSLNADRPAPGGTLEPLTRESGFLIFPSVSRDGTKLAFISHAAYNDELWLQDLKTGKRSLLSTSTSAKVKPVIDADGSRVFYESEETGQSAIYVISSAGGTAEKVCEPCGWPWEISTDHTRLLSFELGQGSVGAAVIDLQTRTHSMFLERPGMDLYQFHWSPDGQWITFFAGIESKTKTVVYVARSTGDRGPNERAWIQLTDSASGDSHPRWSPNGNWLYTLSERDGFRCIWATPLDSQTKRPAGQPVAVFHSHGARSSLRNANWITQELSVTRDKIIFDLGEITGNIWMTELEETKK